MPAEQLSPPRPELLALLDAVKDHPDDDTPRLVLADWLDEQDNELDAERAKLIRFQIAGGRGEAPADGGGIMTRWLAPLREFITNNVFERGLPHVYVPGVRFGWFAAPAALASETFAFVQSVRLEEAGGPRMEAMAKLPEFRFVPGLSVYPFDPLGTGSSARFFASPNLTGLRQISFRSVQPGAVGTQALAANPALARLRKLNLSHNKLVDKAVEALAAAKHLANLTHLDLSDNNISDKGAALLSVSMAFPSLCELNLQANPRLTNTGKQLLRDAFGERVKLDSTLF